MVIGNLQLRQDALESFCRKWNIIELSLFGSALRNDFRSDSDVDLLVTFAPDKQPDLIEWARMETELEVILGRKADLVERCGVEGSENYIRRRQILSTAKPVYVA